MQIVDRAARSKPGRALALVVELHGQTDNLVALLRQQGRRDRRIDSSRHGDDDAHTDGSFRRCHELSPIAHSTLRAGHCVNVSHASARVWQLCTTPGSFPDHRLRLGVPLAETDANRVLRAVSGKPIARSTWDGSSVPDEQADPVDTAIPSRSRAINSDSASIPSKLMFVVFGDPRLGCAVDRGPGNRRQHARARDDRAARRAGRARSQLGGAQAWPLLPGRRSRGRSPCRRAACARVSRPSGSHTTRVPRRIQSAPAPFGPLNLCAESDSRSTPSALTSTGILPRSARRRCGTAPRAHARRCASSAIGWMVPISLFACITDTIAVSSANASLSASGSTIPVLETGSSVIRQPLRASALNVTSTASCSIAVAIRCRRPVGSSASAAPRSAKLSRLGAAAREDDLRRFGANQRAHRAPRASSNLAFARWPK